MKLEGTFETFSLRELIDIIVYSSVTGVLNIFGPGESGHLYFRDGSLYHVERGPARGVEALGELFELRSASFSFESEVVVAEETLYGSLAALVAMAEDLGSRWRKVRAHIPRLELVGRVVVSREQAERRVHPHHYPVLAAFDGQRSLRQVAAEIGWAEIDVAEASADMSADGVLMLRAPQQGGGHAAGGEGAPAALPAGGGLFDRILARRPATADALPAQAPVARRDDSAEQILRFLRGTK